MHQDRYLGRLKQLTGRLKEHWGELLDDEDWRSEGNRLYLAGKIQECRGIATEAARRAIRKFDKSH